MLRISFLGWNTHRSVGTIGCPKPGSEIVQVAVGPGPTPHAWKQTKFLPLQMFQQSCSIKDWNRIKTSQDHWSHWLLTIDLANQSWISWIIHVWHPSSPITAQLPNWGPNICHCCPQFLHLSRLKMLDSKRWHRSDDGSSRMAKENAQRSAAVWVLVLGERPALVPYGLKITMTDSKFRGGDQLCGSKNPKKGDVQASVIAVVSAVMQQLRCR